MLWDVFLSCPKPLPFVYLGAFLFSFPSLYMDCVSDSLPTLSSQLVGHKDRGRRAGISSSLTIVFSEGIPLFLYKVEVKLVG